MSERTGKARKVIDRIRSMSNPLEGQADRRLLDAAVAALIWLGAWLAVRWFGGANSAVAAAYVVPVAFTAQRFGWHAGAATGILSAFFAGPLSPALEAVMTDAETVTFATVFAAVAGLAALTRRPATSDAQDPTSMESLGGVARELRAPVQAIQGAVALLDRVAPKDGEERVAVGTLARAADRIHELEGLLSAVGEELATERRAHDQQLVDLRLVAGDVATELRRQGGLERLRFDAAYDADAFMGHQDQIHTLLRCLVGEALETAPTTEPIDCSVRRDVDTLVVRVCAPSEGSQAVLGRIRLVAAEQLTERLGGTFEAFDAGGALQLTVRLPQRRDADPIGQDATRRGSPVTALASGAATTPSGGTSGVWARVAG